MTKLTPEQIELIKTPLPAEAISPHPTKPYLSSIKAIYVTERLNEVFGIGAWTIKTQAVSQSDKGMVVCLVTLEVPEYGIYYESYGGNDNGGAGSKNFDLGDAYKGATTDAITKICSYIGIGIDVFKGKQSGGKATPQTQEKGDKGDYSCSKCGSVNKSPVLKHGKYGDYFSCSECGKFSDNKHPVYNGEDISGSDGMPPDFK